MTEKRDSYKPYIRTLWNPPQTVFTRPLLSEKATVNMEINLFHIFDKIARSAKTLLEVSGKKTMDVNFIRDACYVVVPGALGILAGGVAMRSQRRKDFIFPQSLIHRFLKTGQFGVTPPYATRVSPSAAAALSAVLEEVAVFILTKAMEHMHGETNFPLTSQKITQAIQANPDLRVLMRGRPVDIPTKNKNPTGGGQAPRPTSGKKPKPPGGAQAPKPKPATRPTPTGEIINSVQEMERFLAKHADRIRQVLLAQYSKKEFRLCFHPNGTRCIASVKAIEQLFAKLGQSVTLNILGTQGCDAIYKKFSHLY